MKNIPLFLYLLIVVLIFTNMKSYLGELIFYIISIALLLSIIILSLRNFDKSKSIQLAVFILISIGIYCIY